VKHIGKDELPYRLRRETNIIYPTNDEERKTTSFIACSQRLRTPVKKNLLQPWLSYLFRRL
jgi:hypothetical protein